MAADFVDFLPEVLDRGKEAAFRCCCGHHYPGVDPPAAISGKAEKIAEGNAHGGTEGAVVHVEARVAGFVDKPPPDAARPEPLLGSSPLECSVEGLQESLIGSQILRPA